jgi:hypothetical protein
VQAAHALARIAELDNSLLSLWLITLGVALIVLARAPVFDSRRAQPILHG